MTTFTRQFSWPWGVEGWVNESQISETYIGFSLISTNSIGSKLESNMAFEHFNKHQTLLYTYP